MNEFSLLVRKKYQVLNSEQKQIFEEEYNRRKKPFGDDYNSDLAMDILRDIALTFENENSIQENKGLEKENISVLKTNGNSAYLPSNKNSKVMLLFNTIFFLIIGIAAVTIYTKPSTIRMENDILNKYLETQPQVVKVFKNMFIGEYKSQDEAENVMYNIFREKGKDILIDELDFVFLKKIKIKDEVSKKTLVEAYGFWGMTLIDIKDENSEINSVSNEMNGNNHSENIDDSSNYNNYDEPQLEEKQESNIQSLQRKRGERLQEIKVEPKEDSIKI